MTWREYHEATKHTAEGSRRSTHYLDWANMPDPFRHYEGVPVLDLPADPPRPEAPAADGPTFLSQLLYYSAAISASKRVPTSGLRYALRVNPSSGNLHPTEFHFITRGLKNWPDGLYHYRPSSHMAEQRAAGDINLEVSVNRAPITFVLTTIAWREAWKYRDRAFRYCLHDIGHAWQCVALAAGALGCESTAVGEFADDEVSGRCRLHDDEWPMLILEVRGRSIPTCEPGSGPATWYGGCPNQLSPEPISYPRIDAMYAATNVLREHSSVPSAGTAALAGARAVQLAAPMEPTRTFGDVARTRRSALDFIGGPHTISLRQLSALLASASSPLSSDFSGMRSIYLYLYVHRVHELEAGVYRFHRVSFQLERVKEGDQRVVAAGLSLGQNLAGNACVAFSMIGDLERATRVFGDRGYRYVHFEAGAIGQRLYVSAEGLGLRATGIGAFYDDEVNRYLEIEPERGQVVYHFAVGYPVPDARLAG